MKRNFSVIFLLSIVAQLGGCGSNVKPQPSAPVVDSVIPIEPSIVTTPEVSSAPIVLAPVTPQIQTPAPSPASNAIASLAVQARAQYQAKNYQAAIAIAERGLRIDRRAPELYLLLAQSYFQLANTPLALQFVQQGIRYAQAGSEVAQGLLKIKDALPH